MYRFLRHQAPPLAHKYIFAVISEKVCIRFSEFVGHANWLTREGNKVLLQSWLWKVTAEPLAEDNSELFIQRDKSGIKGRIVQT